MAMATLEYQREYYQKHKQYWRDYYLKNREKIRTKAKIYYNQNPEGTKARARLSQQRVRREVLTYYGNGKCACVRCGESRLACLSIDHIKGGGHRHLVKLGKSGSQFIYWLRQQGFPKGYQTLCMNCQCVKRSENNECMPKGKD